MSLNQSGTSNSQHWAKDMDHCCSEFGGQNPMFPSDTESGLKTHGNEFSDRKKKTTIILKTPFSHCERQFKSQTKTSRDSFTLTEKIATGRPSSKREHHRNHIYANKTTPLVPWHHLRRERPAYQGLVNQEPRRAPPPADLDLDHARRLGLQKCTTSTRECWAETELLNKH